MARWTCGLGCTPIPSFVSAAWNHAAPIRLQYSVYVTNRPRILVLVRQPSECSSVIYIFLISLDKQKKKIFTHPPKIAKYGCFGFSMACPKYTNSFFKRKPAAWVGSLIPTIELRREKGRRREKVRGENIEIGINGSITTPTHTCVLCELSQKSLTYTSPNSVREEWNCLTASLLGLTCGQHITDISWVWGSAHMYLTTNLLAFTVNSLSFPFRVETKILQQKHRF